MAVLFTVHNSSKNLESTVNTDCGVLTPQSQWTITVRLTNRVFPIETMKSKNASRPAQCPGEFSCTWNSSKMMPICYYQKTWHIISHIYCDVNGAISTTVPLHDMSDIYYKTGQSGTNWCLRFSQIAKCFLTIWLYIVHSKLVSHNNILPKSQTRCLQLNRFWTVLHVSHLRLLNFLISHPLSDFCASLTNVLNIYPTHL